MKGALCALLLLPGCRGAQHVLDPRGPQAQVMADISWLLYISAALIFLVVMAIAAYAVFGPAHKRARLAHRGLIIGGGITFPIVALTALMIYVFAGAPDLLHRGKPMLHIEVVGEQFWWRVLYLDKNGRPQLETANEIHIPVGVTVELRLRSADVIHSFWVPSLHGKLDMIPGHVNTMRMQADRAGVSRGQCAEYCGAQHAKMAFLVIALEPARFDQWFAAQMQSAHAPATAQLRRGQELFMSTGCVTCHTVRGTDARGVIGPDLTHIGSRRTIGAGLFPNTVGALGGWIADSQALKPGNRMPAFSDLKGEELRALAAYMESLQ